MWKFESVADSSKKVNQKFQFYFKIDAQRFMDGITTVITGRFNLNIIAFDDWLHRQGYTEEKDGSMRDYIKATYGESAASYIEGLLKKNRIKEGVYMLAAILNRDEIVTVISRFRSSIYRLEQTGDYPEKVSDRRILRKLIDMAFFISREDKISKGVIDNENLGS